MTKSFKDDFYHCFLQMKRCSAFSQQNKAGKKLNCKAEINCAKVLTKLLNLNQLQKDTKNSLQLWGKNSSKAQLSHGLAK